MGFNLTVTDCSNSLAQPLMTVAEIIKGEAFFIPGDHESLGYLMDGIEGYYGKDIDNFLADLPCDPENFIHVADKMERFASLIKESCSLSQEERRAIRKRVRESRDG
jgi:hypothetical protein